MSLLELLWKLTPLAAEWAVMLLPLALYFLYLAYGIHRRPRPTVLSGPANTLQLAVAASGLLLLGPVTWLLSPLLPFGLGAYAAGFAGYLLFLGLLVAAELRRSRRLVWILNIDPEDLDGLFSEVATGGPKMLRQDDQLSFPELKSHATIRAEPAGRCVRLQFSRPSDHAQREFTSRLRQVCRSWNRESSPLAGVYSLLGGAILLYCMVSFLYFHWYLQHFEK